MLMTPLPDTLTVYGMFVPRFQSLTDGARCQVATAVLQLADGDRAGAENTLREVLSTGLLMLDDGTHLITNLIGIVVVGVAAEALEDFYAATGDQRSADRIHELREGAEHAAGTGGTRGPIDTESAVREMARMARDPGMMRGLRWEFVAIVSHLAPCMNLHGAIHGPGTDYRGWLEATRTSLVRYPAEESLFDVYARSSEAGAMTGEEDDFLWKLFGAAQRLLGIRGGCAL
jgi:hypothetical protein